MCVNELCHTYVHECVSWMCENGHMTCVHVIWHAYRLVTYEWVISHMNETCPQYRWVTYDESCPIWIRYAPHIDESQMNESSPIWMRHTPHINESHMNESCPICMRHVPHIDESQLKKSCPIWMSHVPHEWFLSKKWIESPTRNTQRTLPHAQYTATNCNTLQHTATHRNTPQRTATHCNTLQQQYHLCTCKSVSYKWVMSHMDESHMNEPCPISQEWMETPTRNTTNSTKVIYTDTLVHMVITKTLNSQP